MLFHPLPYLFCFRSTSEIFTKQDLPRGLWRDNTLKDEKERVELGKSTC